jgi:hypothetical protein
LVVVKAQPVSPSPATVRLLCLLALSGCVSSRAAPLSVRVTSAPAGAAAQLHCPNVPVQSGVTPATFRVPAYATPCALLLSREGYRDKRLDVTLDMLQARHSGYVAPPREPIRFTEDATPFSLLGALLARGVENLGASLSERATSALVPDARIEVVLEPTRP